MLREPKIKETAAPMSGEVSSGYFRQKFAENPDVIINEIAPGGGAKKNTVAFVDGLVSSQLTDDYVIKPLVQDKNFTDANEQVRLERVMLGAVYHCQRKLCTTIGEAEKELLFGAVLIFFDEAGAAVAFDVKGFEKRGVSEPSSENVLKGAKEGFIEVLRANTAMLRRRLRTGDLMINQITVGARSETGIAVVYLNGVAKQGTVEAVKARLEAINIDGVVSAGQIEAFLLDGRGSIFPRLLYTERLDKFCANILEGRVGILIDGLPIGYITPCDLFSFMQAPEDYAYGYITASLLRLLRYVCAFSALLLPAVYVSMTTFHQEMIPTKLAVSIISNKQGVPFPSYLEVLLMLTAFEILLEAGLRMPKAIGQATSIVGGLVVGQAAISAGILSPGVVIVIAAAGITGFVIPSQDLSNTIRLLRVVLVLLSVMGGLFAVSLGLIAIVYRMCTLETFGVPYLSPFAGADGRRMFSDTIVRAPWRKAKYRPVNIPVSGNTKRQGGE